MTILNIIYVALMVVLLFGASIFIHELGHFLVALLRGMKVEEFAIGFGPKLWSRTKNGIVYSIRGIPAGGYVKLPQMITSQTLEGEAGPDVPPASPWSKILVAVAGPAMNVIFAFAVATVIYFVGLPVPVNPPIVGYVDPASLEARAGIREGDRIVSVDQKPVKTWEEVQYNTILAPSNVVPVMVDRNGKTETFYLGALHNATLDIKLLNLDPRDHPVVINEVSKGDPAEQAGLQAKDELVSFGGVPVVSQEQLTNLVNRRVNEATPVVVKRGDRKLTLTVTPRLKGDSTVGRIGVTMDSGAIYYEVQRPGPTPWEQVKTDLSRMGDLLQALRHSKQTGVGISNLSGPLGIGAMLASQVNADFRLALRFLVLLNVNLAVLNLLPIPVLDGGHILMSIIEKIRRRPLGLQFVEYTTTAFAVVIISFFLFVSYHDLKKLPLFRSIISTPTHVESSPSATDPSPLPAPAH